MAAESRFGSALSVTLWLAGLLIAMTTGNLAAYVVLSGLYIGSKVVRRLRASGGGAERLDPGEPRRR